MIVRPQRLYTRYAFSAHAVIIDNSGAEIPGHVTNISFGGCRLFAIGQFPLGTEVTIKFHKSTDYFEATATVAHSAATDVGVIFGNFREFSLLVLRKWIRVA
jgi:hypothetical protein